MKELGLGSLKRVFVLRGCQHAGLADELTPQGKQEAESLARFLVDEHGVTKPVIAHSPVTCARQTAACLAHRFGVAFESRQCLFSDGSHQEIDHRVLHECLSLAEAVGQRRNKPRDLILVTHYHHVGELPQYLVEKIFTERERSVVVDRGCGWLVDLSGRPRLSKVLPEVPLRRIRTARVPA